MKTTFFHGITAGALAALAALVYNEVFHRAMPLADFSTVITVPGMIAACMLGCIVASLGYYGLRNVMKKHADVVFNVIFTAITFASLAVPYAKKLPLKVEFPELFIGLAIPMHLFPQLFWMTSKALFNYSQPSTLTKA